MPPGSALSAAESSSSSARGAAAPKPLRFAQRPAAPPPAVPWGPRCTRTDTRQHSTLHSPQPSVRPSVRPTSSAHDRLRRRRPRSRARGELLTAGRPTPFPSANCRKKLSLANISLGCISAGLPAVTLGAPRGCAVTAAPQACQQLPAGARRGVRGQSFKAFLPMLNLKRKAASWGFCWFFFLVVSPLPLKKKYYQKMRLLISKELTPAALGC